MLACEDTQGIALYVNFRGGRKLHAAKITSSHPETQQQLLKYFQEPCVKGMRFLPLHLRRFTWSLTLDLYGKLKSTASLWPGHYSEDPPPGAPDGNWSGTVIAQWPRVNAHHQKKGSSIGIRSRIFVQGGGEGHRLRAFLVGLKFVSDQDSGCKGPGQERLCMSKLFSMKKKMVWN